MLRVTQTLNAIVAKITANSRHNGNGKFEGNHHGPLLDMQFKICPDAVEVCQDSLLADGRYVGACSFHILGQGFTGTSVRKVEISLAQLAQQRTGTHVRLAEPGTFFAPKRGNTQGRSLFIAISLSGDEA